MIVVETSRPGKYAPPQCLENDYHGVFLAPHLSPADLSPVFNKKRKLQNVSMVSESFHDHQLLETSRNTLFSEGLRPFFTTKWFGPDKYATCWLRVTSPYFSHNLFRTLLSDAQSFSSSFRCLDLKPMIISGEVSRSLRYCNAKPTRDRSGASSRRFIPLQK